MKANKIKQYAKAGMGIYTLIVIIELIAFFIIVGNLVTINGDNKWVSLMKTALWYKKKQRRV